MTNTNTPQTTKTCGCGESTRFSVCINCQRRKKGGFITKWRHERYGQRWTVRVYETRDGRVSAEAITLRNGKRWMMGYTGLKSVQQGEMVIHAIVMGNYQWRDYCANGTHDFATLIERSY